jgi:hypothetical protein
VGAAGVEEIRSLHEYMVTCSLDFAPQCVRLLCVSVTLEQRVDGLEHTCQRGRRMEMGDE